MKNDTPFTPVKGYSQLSTEQLALMNEGKAIAEQVGAFIAKLRTYPATPPGQPGGEHYGKQSIDQRWVSIGATELQQGFMAVLRGIAQPTTF